MKEQIDDKIINEELKTDSSLGKKEQVEEVIKKASIVCAVTALAPIPFSDIFLLTPIQCIMVIRMSKIYGFSMTKEEATKIIGEMTAVIGMGVIAQHLIVAGYKTFIPYLGAFTSVPIVYGFTYAIGKVMDKYFQLQLEGQEIGKEQIKNIFKSSLNEGKSLAKKLNKEELKAKAKEWMK